MTVGGANTSDRNMWLGWHVGRLVATKGFQPGSIDRRQHDLKQTIPRDQIRASETGHICCLFNKDGQMRYMVRAVGLEPTRAYALRILSPICLPFHHARVRNADSNQGNRKQAHNVRYLRLSAPEARPEPQGYARAATDLKPMPFAMHRELRHSGPVPKA